LKTFASLLAFMVMGGAAYGSVSISSPTNSSTVGSPVHFVASASSSRTITHFNVYIDNNKVYGKDTNRLDTYISVSSGSHKAVVKAWDSSGASQSATVYFSVSGSSSTGSGVYISSPSSGSTVGSPVHFVASASGASHMNIYVDSSKVYGKDTSKIDTYISVGSGSHKATIRAWDSGGSSISKTISFSVGSSSSSTSTSTSSSATNFWRLEEVSGWHACSACANAGGGATYSMTQGISSPSLDGDSAKFSLGGSTPWSHALFYKRVSSNGTASHFIYDIYYYYKHPSASSGMEFSVSQRRGYRWYRWDTQCSYNVGLWRLWDNANARWVNTSIPCTRPSAYKWTHLVYEGKRYNGKVVFVSLTINGQKHYLNKSYYPKKMSTSNSSVTMHFQLNGNRYQTDYQVWGDRFHISYW